MQRRMWICRWAFLLFGGLPLMITMVGLVVRTRGDNLQQWRTRWQQSLGMSTQIVDLVHPRPGVLRWNDVTLSHPESQALALRCDRVEQVRDAQGIHLRVTRASIQTGQWATLRWTLFERLFTQPNLPEVPVDVVIDRLTFTGPVDHKVARDVRVQLDQTDQGRAAWVDFYWEGQPATDRVHVHVLRRGPDARVPTRVEVLTGDVALSCATLLGPDDALARQLGNLSLRGNLWVEPHDAGWNAEFSGELTGIDLQRWVGAPFRYQVQGDATAEITRAIVADGVIRELLATLRCPAGKIDHALLAAAQTHLPLMVVWPTSRATQPDATQPDDAPMEEPGTAIPFTDLAILVELNQDGLRLAGLVPAAGTAGRLCALVPEGAVQYDGDAPVSPTALLRTLVPASRHAVPVHDASKALLLALPLE